MLANLIGLGLLLAILVVMVVGIVASLRRPVMAHRAHAAATAWRVGSDDQEVEASGLEPGERRRDRLRSGVSGTPDLAVVQLRPIIISFSSQWR